MIVNHDKKFIFVGLPFSACSAISKELLENYDCESLLHKHASIPVLQRARPDINIREYAVVLVVRDPIEACLTLYHWMKDNRNDRYTDPKNFLENGGPVPKRPRKIFKVIHERNMSFEEYLEYCYRFVPYDGLLSENSRFANKVIRFERLQDDFRECFESLGLKIKRDLPSYNKTENKTKTYEVSAALKNRVFGPYIRYNKDCFKGSNVMDEYDLSEVGLLNYVRFLVFRSMRTVYRLRLDLKLMGRDLSAID